MLKILDSTYRQIGFTPSKEEEIREIFTFKKEEFSFQIELNLDSRKWLNVNKDLQIPWEGLEESYRLEVTGEGFTGGVYFLDSLLDDDGQYKKDRIVRRQGQKLDKGYHTFWVDGFFEKPGNHDLKISLYSRKDYEKEIYLSGKKITVEVADYEISKKNDFYLDLWQHLSSIARKYEVKIWSHRHFELLEEFLMPLREAGGKVVTLPVSDYIWCGQGCFENLENPSSLYEYNIVEVFRENGKISCNFEYLERYIDLCKKLGMNEEYNIFGLITNWNWSNFGTGMTEDMPEPFRIRLYDKDEKSFDFIRTVDELQGYIKLLFKFLDEKGIFHKLKIMGDQPKEADTTLEMQEFLQSLSKKPLDYKYAINNDFFKEANPQKVDSFSIQINEAIKEFQDKENRLEERREDMTWYVCWRPKGFNQFIKSPLMESRLIGPLTYLLNFKGFLRWNYCLWTDSEDVRYWGDRWPAGDMFFVYPGKDGRPDLSLRFKQMTYGIRDFQFLKEMEEKLGREIIIKELENLFSSIDEMKILEEATVDLYDEKILGEDRVEIPYCKDFRKYQDILKKLYEKSLKI